jgi:hypothetical protein
MRHAVAQLRHGATNWKVVGSISDDVTDIILPAALCLWGRLSLYNRNEYQEHYLKCKGGRCVTPTTLPHSRADCIKIGGFQPLGL